MIPMSQYSLTQLENLAKEQDNDVALELIQRIDDSFFPTQGKPAEVPSFYDLDNEKEEKYEEGFSAGENEGLEEGAEKGKEEVLDAVKSYLFSLDFTEENIETFISEVKSHI